MRSTRFLSSLFVVLALILSATFTVHANELLCGNIIAPQNWSNFSSDIETLPIEDCSDPFKASVGVLSPHTLFIDNREVHDGDVVVIPEAGVREYSFSGDPILDNASGFFFLHDGDDYRFINTEPVGPIETDFRVFAETFFQPGIEDVEPYIQAILDGGPWGHEVDEDLFWQFQNAFWDQFVEEPVKLLPGTYTLVIKESQLILTQGFLRKLFASIIPIVHAEGYPEYTFTVTFTLTVEEDQIDPLLLRYLPILRMHPDEDFLPMNVEAFVGASALWDDASMLFDEVIQEAGDVTIEMLSSLEDGGDHYLAFSDPENAKSFNVDAALLKYNELIDEDVAQTTVYARKMRDSYEDSFGEKHEFIVLQYWYFYAMNDWKEKGGLNNHEGDWESVFVFLDAGTEEPEYVAFSAHHNDGEADALGIIQYDSVRRIWDDGEIERESSGVVSYVALGSHANYPRAGNYKVGAKSDNTSGDGESLVAIDFAGKIDLEESQSSWLSYGGKWGADRIDLFEGSSGPRGPYFIDVSGHLRFHEPLEWAGIDKIEEMVTEAPATVFSFPGTGIELNFEALVPTGTRFLTAPYFEPPKGTTPLGTQLLSPFWDIESSLENGTFGVQAHLPIDHESLLEAGGSANFNAYWFNPDTQGWEKQESTVDGTGQFVVFNTNHFSRYAIGIQDAQETLVVEEEETDTTSSNSTGTRVGDRSTLIKAAEPLPLAQNAVTSDAETAAYEKLITLLQQVIVMYKEKGYLTPLEVKSLVERFNQITVLLKS